MLIPLVAHLAWVRTTTSICQKQNKNTIKGDQKLSWNQYLVCLGGGDRDKSPKKPLFYVRPFFIKNWSFFESIISQKAATNLLCLIFKIWLGGAWIKLSPQKNLLYTRYNFSRRIGLPSNPQFLESSQQMGIGPFWL